MAVGSDDVDRGKEPDSRSRLSAECLDEMVQKTARVSAKLWNNRSSVGEPCHVLLITNPANTANILSTAPDG